MKVNIIRDFDDENPCSIGLMETPDTEEWDYLESDEISARIEKLWEEFQATEPNSDNDFIDYLIKKGFEELENDVLDVVL